MPGERAGAILLVASHLQVQLLRWEVPRGGGDPEVHVMNPGEKGTWSLHVPLEWEGSYYKYRCGEDAPLPHGAHFHDVF